VKDSLPINWLGTESRRFFRFVAASGVAAAVNVLSRVALSEYLDYRWAVALAYLCGMATAFTLNKLLVFAKSGKALHREMLWFCLVNVVAAAQVWFVSIGLAEYLFPAVRFAWRPELSCPHHRSELGCVDVVYRPQVPLSLAVQALGGKDEHCW
jgi:putative flippase GtrA